MKVTDKGAGCLLASVMAAVVWCGVIAALLALNGSLR